MYEATRGLRNNNPGNIRKGDAWQGMAADQPDPDFVTFVSIEWGIRALAEVMQTYYYSHNLRTVRQIITRYAPPGDSNNTDAYVTDVADRLGVGPSDQINVMARLPDLIHAITHHENGMDPLSDAQVLKGIQMAGIDTTQYA